jgi:hypothetical protein
VTKRSNLSTAMYLLLVFLSGVLVGVFSYRLYMVNTVQSGSVARTPPRNPEEYRKRAVAEMTARLKLSADQVGTLQQIMDETRQRYHDLRDRQRPDLKAIEADHYQRIRAMLTEPQRAEYDKMRAEREQRRQQTK